jgi:hypothetical protein
MIMVSEAVVSWIFFGAWTFGAALSLILPGVLKVTQERAQEWVMMGLLPVCLWAVWVLRPRPPAAPAEAPLHAKK